MPTISTPYASGTITAVSGTTVTVSGGATAAWIGRCIRMQNGTAQGQIRRITAVASATSITVDYAWNISPYTGYGFTEANPTAGNTFVISHALDDIDDGTTLIKDSNNNYFRLVAGQSLNMDGGSWLYDTSKVFEFDSNFIRCNGATGCFRFGDIDASGFVANGCMLIETSPGTAGINNWATAASGLTPTSPDMHIYGGTIIVRGVGSGNNQAAFWRLYRDATQIVRMDGVYVDGNFGARLMGSRSVAKGWRVYNNQSPLGAFNPKSPFGKIDDIQVIASLQALYHFWTESQSAEAEGIIARGVTRLLRFAATGETGFTLELKDIDVPAASALNALYQNDNPVGAPGNTLRLSQFLDVRLPNAAGALITTTARVVVRDVLGATVVDTTTTSGTIPRQTLRYRDMSIQGAGAFTWANAGGTTYAPYAVAFAAYGFLPATLPLPLDTSQAISMVALADSNITLSAVAAAALSSKFSINASGNITVTANATLDELYDYAAIWITQSAANLLIAGMGQFLVTAAGTELRMTRDVTVNAGVTLSVGAKFKTFSTTGTVTNNGNVATPYTDASGTLVTLRTADNLALSTYLTINGVPQAWVTNNAARKIFVQSNSVVRIYAHAYGKEPVIVNVTGNNPADYVISLVPEVNVDTAQASRDTIAAALSVGVDGSSRIFLGVSADLRQYTPAQVLHGLHWFVLNNGAPIAAAAVAAGDLNGFALMRGGFVVRTPGFYGKVVDAVTSVTDLGIMVPLAISVDPSVYVAMPTYTPVVKNTSGIVLQYAPWTQQAADVPTWVARETSLIVVNEGVKKASTLIPHTTSI